MKIVAFEGQGGTRLGIVEGDQVIDLNAADGNLPADLGEILAKNNGDARPLADIAKRAPASARKPLADLTYRLPVGRPGKIICLGLNYLEHVKEGPQRDNIPKFPTIFMRGLDLAGAARPADHAPAGHRNARLRSRDDPGGRQARQAPDGRQCALLHRRLFLRQRGIGARIPAQDDAMGHGQEFRPHRRLRPLARDRRRASARRQGTEDRKPAQRQGDAVRQYRQHDVPDCRDARVHHPRHDA